MKTTTPTGDVVHAPHRPLTDYYADESERAGFVRGMFDRTAGTYDRIERILALGSGVWYRGQRCVGPDWVRTAHRRRWDRHRNGCG
jgi:demethylmenaquinone methyltransferase/2-methoxy-6-polyprenyl-1,4-benzoquinol methylase